MEKFNIWIDKSRGEVFFNNSSICIAKRDYTINIQNMCENLIGPATKLIFKKAFEEIMTPLFLGIAQTKKLDRKYPVKFARALIKELPKYGYGVAIIDEIDTEKDYVRVRVDNCFNSIATKKREKPICYCMEGILAGLFSLAFKKDIECREVKCAASGNKFCEFDIDMINPKTQRFPQKKMEKRKLSRIEISYDPNKGEIIHQGINSCFFPRYYFKALELETNKITGPASKGLFYMITKKNTIDSIKQGILSDIIVKVVSVVNKDKFIDILEKIGLERGYGRIEVMSVDFEKKIAVIRVFNSFNLFEIRKSKEPVCYSLGGILSASGDIVFGKPTRCVETKCEAMGDPYCEFLIKLE